MKDRRAALRTRIVLGTRDGFANLFIQAADHTQVHERIRRMADIRTGQRDLDGRS
jgi:hypothetical protein